MLTNSCWLFYYQSWGGYGYKSKGDTGSKYEGDTNIISHYIMQYNSLLKPKKKITEVNRANLQTDPIVITVVEKHFNFGDDYLKTASFIMGGI
jgi:hypothetical protein